MKKFGIVDNFKRWIKLREIRNDVAHEYQHDIQETVNALPPPLTGKRRTAFVLQFHRVLFINQNMVK